MKQTIYYCKGYPGCGKSTLASKMVEAANGKLVEANRDTFRKEHPQYVRGKFNKVIESSALLKRNSTLEGALAKGLDVISSDTNLSKTHIAYFESLAKKYGASLVCLDFINPDSQYYVPLKECFKRDLLRNDSVGKDVILKMYYENEISKVLQPEWHDVLPNAWICDIDGTLAHHEGVRGAYEEKYHLDLLDRTVFECLKAFKNAGHTIIILSGREGSMLGEQQTKAWLETHQVPYDLFYMRSAGDRRSDTIIKQELYEKKIKFRFNILGVVDDRPSVCRMWEEQGLKVLKCGPGYEF